MNINEECLLRFLKNPKMMDLNIKKMGNVISGHDKFNLSINSDKAILQKKHAALFE